MNELATPSVKNNSINKGKEFSRKIRNIILKEETKSSNTKLSEENYLKDFKINLDKIVSKHKSKIDQIVSNRNYTKISLPFIMDKNKNKNLNSFKTENLLNDGNEFNDIINAIKNKKRKNFTNDKMDYKSKKNKKYKNFIEVNKIVNSLINSPKNTRNEFLNLQDKVEKIKYPREKMIDPIYYIKYNITNKKLKKGADKSFNQYIQEIEDINSEPVFLKETSGVNYGNIRIEHPNTNTKEKTYRDLLKEMDKRKDFIFELKDLNYYKRIKNKKRNEKNNKSEIASKFKKLIIDVHKKKNIKLIDSFIDNKIDKYKSFDERMNLLLNNTKSTENNIKQKSKYHEKLITKINNIYKSY